jgi:hypothetical protein
MPSNIQRRVDSLTSLCDDLPIAHDQRTHRSIAALSGTLGEVKTAPHERLIRAGNLASHYLLQCREEVSVAAPQFGRPDPSASPAIYVAPAFVPALRLDSIVNQSGSADFQVSGED